MSALSSFERSGAAWFSSPGPLGFWQEPPHELDEALARPRPANRPPRAAWSRLAIYPLTPQVDPPPARDFAKRLSNRIALDVPELPAWTRQPG